MSKAQISNIIYVIEKHQSQIDRARECRAWYLSKLSDPTDLTAKEASRLGVLDAEIAAAKTAYDAAKAALLASN